ncbi:MAG TPA: molybdate ABC transporter substrate-binding protein [Caldilineae bacterium]|nr:molybdate ABC transporter substrate-binding protein [Caldilineae bacterium]
MVAAASSLRGAFDDIARAFEEETGTSVTISFGSSGQLAQQIENGAPFDVFASANEAYVDRLAERGFVLLDTRRVYARGRLALVVNRERGASVKRLEDLADPSLGPIAIANPDHAPYGLAAYQALERRRLWEQVRSRIVMGENVRQALQFVQIGDAPVGIVALSIADVPEVDYTPISTELHDPLNQTLVILRDSRHPELARRFVAFVTGTAGRAILQRYGFLLPEEP